jgi:hypothetical protein
LPELVVRLDGDGALSDLVDARTDEEVRVLRETGALIDLSDDSTIVVTGFEHGMESGAPSVALGFKLPDGRVVLAQTSWRLFAMAFHALAGKFQTPYPDLVGTAIVHEGLRSDLVIVGDDETRWQECLVCGARQEFEPQSALGSQAAAPLWWLREHFEEKHPGHPGISTVGLKRCAPGEHRFETLEDDNPIGARELCVKCAETR